MPTNTFSPAQRHRSCSHKNYHFFSQSTCPPTHTHPLGDTQCREIARLCRQDTHSVRSHLPRNGLDSSTSMGPCVGCIFVCAKRHFHASVSWVSRHKDSKFINTAHGVLEREAASRHSVNLAKGYSQHGFRHRLREEVAK